MLSNLDIKLHLYSFAPHSHNMSEHTTNLTKTLTGRFFKMLKH